RPLRFSSPLRPAPRVRPSFPPRRSSDLELRREVIAAVRPDAPHVGVVVPGQLRHLGVEQCSVVEVIAAADSPAMLEDLRGVRIRSEEHTSELQSRENIVCRLLLEKKKKT